MLYNKNKREYYITKVDIIQLLEWGIIKRKSYIFLLWRSGIYLFCFNLYELFYLVIILATILLYSYKVLLLSVYLWRYLDVGRDIVASLQYGARCPCGYCHISDVESHKQEDHMESFFLAETVRIKILLDFFQLCLHMMVTRVGRLIFGCLHMMVTRVGRLIFGQDSN